MLKERKGNIFYKINLSFDGEYLLLSLQLEQKVIASEIFKGKKDNYPQSVPRLFINTRLGELNRRKQWGGLNLLFSC